jgi:hypothetical protein
MKNAFLTICPLFLFAFFAQAQLTNTRWKGQMMIPSPNEVILDFRIDTVYLFVLPDSQLVETMIYSRKDSIITLTKVSGHSPCDETQVGKYQVSWKDDNLHMLPTNDPCESRFNAFIDAPWTKLN